ncbi:MAG: two-component regulator propeller domain-containing protein [Chitinophagaceae bacterium]
MIVFSCRVYGFVQLLLAILFFSVFETHGQNVSFERLSAEDGLSQNSVLAITQDHQGFMWFGTRFGLNRYDARRFMVYRANNAVDGNLSNSYILSLLSDSRNELWVGTRNGLNRYHPENDTFEKIAFEKKPGKDVYINWLFEDRQKRIWAAANGSVYMVRDVNKPLLTLFDPLANAQLGMTYVVFEDSKGITWIGAETGLYRLTPAGNSFDIKIYKHDPKDPNSLADNNITCVAEDKKGNLWIGTLNGGLHRFDQLKEAFIHYHHSGTNTLLSDHVRKILPDNNDQLWIGTQEGISVFNINTQQFKNYANEPGNTASLSQNSVHSLFMDNAGTIWAGTFFGGVNNYSPYFNHFDVFNNNSDAFRLNNNVISSVVEDRARNLWIGTEGGGLNYCDLKTGKVTYLINDPARQNSLGSNLIKVIYKDKDNDIWIGTHGGGLNRVNYSSNGISFTRYTYDAVYGDAPGLEITSVLQDSKGILWVGTERRGVRPFIKTGDKLIADTSYRKTLSSFRYVSVGCLLETNSNTLWIGTTDGIYTLKGQELKKIAATNGLAVNCLFEDASKNIWVGTANSGLVCFGQNGNTIAAYTKKDGLSQENILGILPDKAGNLWISTGDGLVRMNADKTFKTFNRHDGLAGNTFNNNSYYRAADGKMYFGGYDGLISFYPDQIKENKQPAPVFITGISFPEQRNSDGKNENTFGKSLLNNGRLELKYNQNVFTVDFALLNFIKPGKNNYAYKLEGYDENWRYSTEPSASFTNVPPGSYTFLCKGSNNDGVWGNAVALKVVITPPFWKTWWAYTIYTILLAGLVFFIAYFFYLRALYKRNNELTQLKLNFFTNISHEIRTHLSLIIAPSEKLVRSSHKNEVNRQDVQTIRNNSESLLQLVNELMDFRRAETGHLPLHVTDNDVTEFVSRVYASFAEMFKMKNITATYQPLPQVVALWFDKEQMEKVLYNLLSNAFKFTPGNGFIKVDLEENSHSVIMRVTNNGKGIARENLDKLFDNYFQENDYGQRNTGYGIGLALSKSIVELHSGHIRVTSEKQQDAGDYLTSFSVELLKGSTHFTQEEMAAVIRQDTSRTSIPQAPVVEQVNENNWQEELVDDIKKTVLVVEDNNGVRTFIKDILQEEYIILESPDGQHGWEQATEYMPDLIISDVMMPVMDGLAFCDKLKTDIRTSHIPVILLTAKTSVENQVNGLQVGADVYLTKPFSIEVLELQVHNLLAARERVRKQFSKLLTEPVDEPVETINGKAGNVLEQQSHVLHPLDEAFLNNVIKLVEDNIDNLEFGVAMLSRLIGMSQPVLVKKMKAITGMSANDFVKSLRLKKACRLLLENRYTVYEIAYMVGYEDSKYFSKEFKKEFGRTPTEFASVGKI